MALRHQIGRGRRAAQQHVQTSWAETAEGHDGAPLDVEPTSLPRLRMSAPLAIMLGGLTVSALSLAGCRPATTEDEVARRDGGRKQEASAAGGSKSSQKPQSDPPASPSDDEATNVSDDSASGGAQDKGSQDRDTHDSDAGSDDTTPTDTSKPAPLSPPDGQAKELATRLGRSHFLIGLGNDLAQDHNNDGAYRVGTTLDIHYAYLAGLPGRGGWPDWNKDGKFVNILTDTADAHGVIPMFTLYAMAAGGENNLSVLTDEDFMTDYLAGAKLMFERLAVFDKPALVHLEPDFWGYTQHGKQDPEQEAALVGSVLDDCTMESESLAGLGHCLVRLARSIAPKVALGFHASAWADPDPAAVSAYLRALGADLADFVVVEALDRDAGCFEAAQDPNCARGTTGYYWDETNQTSPNFHEHLQWASTISKGVGRPLLWWQLPLGVPSDSPGGMPGAYRDNRVKYLFEHVDEFAAAGGVGAAFGTGAGNQTTIDSDGGQFERAVKQYYAAPYAF